MLRESIVPWRADTFTIISALIMFIFTVFYTYYIKPNVITGPWFLEKTENTRVRHEREKRTVSHTGDRGPWQVKCFIKWPIKFLAEAIKTPVWFVWVYSHCSQVPILPREAGHNLALWIWRFKFDFRSKTKIKYVKRVNTRFVGKCKWNTYCSPSLFYCLLHRH